MTNYERIQVHEDPREYRHEIPNIVDEMGLSAAEYRLYGHYKRVGTCYQRIRTIAEITRMNKDTVIKARDRLKRRRLIEIERPADPRERHVVHCRNIWRVNYAHFHDGINMLEPVPIGGTRLSENREHALSENRERKKEPVSKKEPSKKKIERKENIKRKESPEEQAPESEWERLVKQYQEDR